MKIFNDVILHVISELKPHKQKPWLRLCQNSRNLMFGYFSFQPIKKQCYSRVEDRAFSRTCRVRGQGQELELRGQGRTLGLYV